MNTCARLCPARSFRNSSTNDRCSCVIDVVEQPMALPDRTPDRDLLADDVEHALAIDADARVLLDDRGQRAPALKADLEPQVLEAEHQAVHRALRDADREHPRQPAADGERLVGIEQRVDELADTLFGDLSQRAHRILGHRIPGEQRDHVRHERRRQALLVAQHAQDALAVARLQRQDLHALPGRRPAASSRPSSASSRSRVRPAVNGVRSVRSTAVRVVMSSTSDRSSSTARSSRLRSSVWM